jgi:CheY-like chemotaxis protein
MRQMQGDLQVTSTLGKGSCFTLLWPAPIATAAELESTEAEALQTEAVPAGGIEAGPDHKARTAESGAAAGTPKVGAGASAAAGTPASGAGTGTAAKTDGGSAATVQPETAAPRLHVLVAEDNDLNALILTSILKKENYSTEVAKDGQMAVELFKAAAPFAYDVILMDAQMPIMDGYQAARSIRGLKREDARLVRIYACTANTAQEYRDKALAAGMNGFVAKPIDVKKLLGLLEQIAAKRT